MKVYFCRFETKEHRRALFNDEVDLLLIICLNVFGFCSKETGSSSKLYLLILWSLTLKDLCGFGD